MLFIWFVFTARMQTNCMGDKWRRERWWWWCERVSDSTRMAERTLHFSHSRTDLCNVASRRFEWHVWCCCFLRPSFLFSWWVRVCVSDFLRAFDVQRSMNCCSRCGIESFTSLLTNKMHTIGGANHQTRSIEFWAKTLGLPLLFPSPQNENIGKFPINYLANYQTQAIIHILICRTSKVERDKMFAINLWFCWNLTREGSNDRFSTIVLLAPFFLRRICVR